MKVTRKNLKNGIKVVIVETDSELVSANVCIGAGGRYESPQIFGVSHFLEHMVFKGTKKYPSAKIFSEVIESIGGNQNAWTSEEYTAYWCRVPKNYLSLSLDTLYEQVANPLVEEKEVKKEKGAIIAEIDRNHDRPDSYIWSKSNELFWPGQNISSDIPGPKKNIRKFGREHLISYKEKYYVGSNMTISVVGGVKSGDVIKVIEQKFGKIKKGKKILPVQIKEDQNKAKATVIERNTEQAHIILGYKAFSYFDKRRFALSVLTTMLGEGMSSILFREIREKRGLAYTVWGGKSLYSDNGMALFYAGVAPNKAEEAIKIILKEVEKVKNGKFSESDLKRAKEYLKGHYLANFVGTHKLSAWYGTKELISPSSPDLKQLPDFVEKITAKDVTEVANEIFKKEKENLIVLGPFKNKEKFAKILNR